MAKTSRTPGARLRKWLGKNEWTQTDFAPLVSLTVSGLNDLLSGRRRPSKWIAPKIEKLTGIPASAWKVVDMRRDGVEGLAKRRARPSKPLVQARDLHGASLHGERQAVPLLVGHRSARRRGEVQRQQKAARHGR